MSIKKSFNQIWECLTRSWSMFLDCAQPDTRTADGEKSSTCRLSKTPDWCVSNVENLLISWHRLGSLSIQKKKSTQCYLVNRFAGTIIAGDCTGRPVVLLVFVLQTKKIRSFGACAPFNFLTHRKGVSTSGCAFQKIFCLCVRKEWNCHLLIISLWSGVILVVSVGSGARHAKGWVFVHLLIGAGSLGFALRAGLQHWIGSLSFPTPIWTKSEKLRNFGKTV